MQFAADLASRGEFYQLGQQIPDTLFSNLCERFERNHLGTRDREQPIASLDF